MATATAMYHSGHNPLSRIRRKNDTMSTVKGLRQRRLHKAFLRYHDPDNWPMLRKALRQMGRAKLIGNGKHQLVPPKQPPGYKHSNVGAQSSRRKPAGGRPFLTQHTGLPHTPKRSSRRK